MKAIIYYKYAPGFGHIHAGVSSKFIFLPDYHYLGKEGTENQPIAHVLFYAEVVGSFGVEQYGLVGHDELHEEAFAVERNAKVGITEMGGVVNEGSKITNIHIVDLDRHDIDGLIDYTLEKNRLDKLVSKTIKGLVS